MEKNINNKERKTRRKEREKERTKETKIKTNKTKIQKYQNFLLQELNRPKVNFKISTDTVIYVGYQYWQK